MEKVFTNVNSPPQQHQPFHAAAAAATSLPVDDIDDRLMDEAALQVEAMDIRPHLPNRANVGEAANVQETPESTGLMDNTPHYPNRANDGEAANVQETPKSTGENIGGGASSSSNPLAGFSGWERGVMDMGIRQFMVDKQSRLKNNDPPVSQGCGGNIHYAAVVVSNNYPQSAESRERGRTQRRCPRHQEHYKRLSQLEKNMREMEAFRRSHQEHYKRQSQLEKKVREMEAFQRRHQEHYKRQSQLEKKVREIEAVQRRRQRLRLEKKVQEKEEVIQWLQQQQQGRDNQQETQQNHNSGQEQQQQRMAKNNLPNQQQQEIRDPRLRQKNVHKIGKQKLQVAKRSATLISTACSRGKPTKKNLSVTKKLVFEDPSEQCAAVAGEEDLAPQPGTSNMSVEECSSSTALPSAFNSLNFSQSNDANSLINVLDEVPIYCD